LVFVCNDLLKNPPIGAILVASFLATKTWGKVAIFSGLYSAQPIRSE
jgi:hypothetical protein